MQVRAMQQQSTQQARMQAPPDSSAHQVEALQRRLAELELERQRLLQAQQQPPAASSSPQQQQQQQHMRGRR